MDLLHIREDPERGKCVFAQEMISQGGKILHLKQNAKTLSEINTANMFLQLIDENNQPKYVEISGEEEVLSSIRDIRPLQFRNENYRSVDSAFEALKSYRTAAANVKLVEDETGEVCLMAETDISCDSEILLKYGELYWIHRQLETEEDRQVRLVCLIFKDLLSRTDNGISKWRAWSVEECAEFLTGQLGLDLEGETVQSMHCVGYSSRTILYRLLQTIGFVKPPAGTIYKDYPEQLRTLAHQTRDLCFWPVQIGPESEDSEKIRRKLMQSVQFGPNATWIPFPRTCKLFQAAIHNDIDLAKQVFTPRSLTAYGTTNHWTPLHVACRYGSLDVVEFLLKAKAGIIHPDRAGKTPLNLAEENGHYDIAQILLKAYADQSIIVGTVEPLVKTIAAGDGGQNSNLDTVKGEKESGNEAFKKGNFKTAFQMYSRGIDKCPPNHKEMVILYSNRAQVFINVKAYNLALRDCLAALAIDPLHEKTLLRAGHCLENINVDKCLQVLDLMLFVTVPDKLVTERRTTLFLKTMIGKTSSDNETGQTEESLSASFDKIDIAGTSHTLISLSVEQLINLNLETLRAVDKNIGLLDKNLTLE